MSKESEKSSSGTGGVLVILLLGAGYLALSSEQVRAALTSGVTAPAMPDKSGTPVPPTPMNNSSSSSGPDTSWLWKTNSAGGVPAHTFTNPPSGNSCNDGNNLGVSSSADYHVFGPPTVSCQEFVHVLQQAGSPAYKDGVAAEMWGKAVVDGVDPAFELGLFNAESSYGTNPGWGAKGTMNVGNEEYNGNLNNHAPGYAEYTNPISGYHYMDFHRFGREGWVVSTGYTDGWLGWARGHYGSNNAFAIAHHWAGSSADDGPIRSVMDQVRRK